MNGTITKGLASALLAIGACGFAISTTACSKEETPPAAPSAPAAEMNKAADKAADAMKEGAAKAGDAMKEGAAKAGEAMQNMTATSGTMPKM
jgi:hypothetical protein